MQTVEYPHDLCLLTTHAWSHLDPAMQLATLIVLGAAVVGSAIIHLIKVFKELNKPERIPGPTLLPYIGRVHDLPINFMWLKFKEWADRYSGTNGFYMTEMLGSRYLVVTDEKVAEELLVRRAKYNSDRPTIRSLFDSKSTYGSMEYLPLMGKNRESLSIGFFD